MNWATEEDLILRYGEEFIDKLSLRNDFNETAEAYVANEDPARMQSVVQAALDDAKNWLLWKISCCFNLSDFNSLGDVSFIKKFHIKMTIIMLKDGGDCQECKECQDEFADFCNCGRICDNLGVCISSTSKSKFAVQDMGKSCLPTNFCCSCGDKCCCG